MRINDAVIGLFLVILGGGLMIHAASFPVLAGVPYGPDLFPKIICAFIVLGGLILMIQGIRRSERFRIVVLEDWAREPKTYLILGAIVGGMVFYIFVSGTLGFLVTSVIILVPLLLITRGMSRAVSSVAVAVGFSIAVNLIFARGLRIPLPEGVLQGLL